MASQKGFEDRKQDLIDENERRYGEEARARYGDMAVEKANTHVRGMTGEQYAESERLGRELEETLKAAFATGNPAGELAQKACELHKQWLCLFYPDYNREYHRGLGEMYVADERFRANYDKIAPGCTEFLRDAINIYCNE
ncbi:MAG: TipAS antibiotic-recognition domain-containing protein [Coriobacteriia bacterium]|nr:TipAS antibiotic-recognition domain-containing protein [Coriobacteriia bacterium]